MSDQGFRWRLAIVTAAALVMFGLSGVHLTTPSFIKKDVVRLPVVERTATPDGKITRQECSNIEGMKMSDLLHTFGLPADLNPYDHFWDSLNYPIRGDEEKHCNVYFEFNVEKNQGLDDPEHFIVRNVSVDL